MPDNEILAIESDDENGLVSAERLLKERIPLDQLGLRIPLVGSRSTPHVEWDAAASRTGISPIGCHASGSSISSGEPSACSNRGLPHPIRQQCGGDQTGGHMQYDALRQLNAPASHTIAEASR